MMKNIVVLLSNFINYLRKKYYLIKLILLCSLGVSFTLGYLFIQSNDRSEQTKKEILVKKTHETRIMIEELSNDAKEEGELIVEDINRAVNLAYPKNDFSARLQLRKDLEHFVAGDQVQTKLGEIIYNHTKGKYFNVNNNNNDPFVVTVRYYVENGELKSEKKISSDFSTNCLSPFPRTLLEERDKAGGTGHFSKGLVYDAMNNIIDKNMSMSTWHFVPVIETYPWANEVKNMKQINLDVLMDLYLKYDTNLRVLKGFEFLQATKINDDADLSGEDIINPGAMRNLDALLLYYFNNFNFVDQLAAHPEYKERLDSFDRDYTDEVRSLNHYKQSLLFALIINIILVMMMGIALDKTAKEAE